MSVANYGATFRSQVVSNLVGDINIAIVADGAAQTVTPLIQNAGAVEIPLVLGEGTWAVQARAAQNPANAANTYQYLQCRLDNLAGGQPVAVAPAVFGADSTNGSNIEIYYSCAGFVTVAPGATLSLVFRAYVTGNSAAVSFTGGYANIQATKLSV
jgi:hypothetical protein